MKLDPAIIRMQIAALLVQCPEIEEDDVLRADMIEGETDAFDFLSSIVRKIGESKALVTGTDEYIAELRERVARVERRVDALRSLAFKIMQAGDLKKAELPEATLSIRAGTPKVIIIDDAAIPEEFCRIKREPDKAKIKEALTNAAVIAGAVLSNSEPSLSIRTK